jgi:hypothetical protein
MKYILLAWRNKREKLWNWQQPRKKYTKINVTSNIKFTFKNMPSMTFPHETLVCVCVIKKAEKRKEKKHTSIVFSHDKCSKRWMNKKRWWHKKKKMRNLNTVIIMIIIRNKLWLMHWTHKAFWYARKGFFERPIA